MWMGWGEAGGARVGGWEGGLQTLNVAMCEQLTDVSSLAGCARLQAWSSACRRALVVRFCDELTDVSALAGCRSLETLNLAGCDQLTDVSGLAGCVSLRMLDLEFCDQLTDVSGLVGCASLQTLKGCSRLTGVPAGLWFLMCEDEEEDDEDEHEEDGAGRPLVRGGEGLYIDAILEMRRNWIQLE